jgi:hypothetical protein
MTSLLESLIQPLPVCALCGLVLLIVGTVRFKGAGFVIGALYGLFSYLLLLIVEAITGPAGVWVVGPVMASTMSRSR